MGTLCTAMTVTSESCLAGDKCTFQPLCLFVHEDGNNDQLAALRRNIVDILPSKILPQPLGTFPSWEERRRDTDGWRRMNPHEEDLSNARSRQEDGRPARLIGDGRPSSRRPPVCKSGRNCNWKPQCRFGHPEGGNIDTNNSKEALDRRSRNPMDAGSWRKDEQEGERRQQMNQERRKESGEMGEGLRRTPDGIRRTPPKMRRSTKQCRSGPSCTWKPLCLFLHKEGGNDHELAYQNFTAKKGKEVKEEKSRAVERAAKKVEKKFDWEGGSSYSNMLAWCEVAEEVNKAALLEVNEWVLDMFLRSQVELLGGDEDFYDEVDASLKDLELVEDIEDAQKKLYSWRMDFFLDKFKSTYMEDPVSTWTTDGFDDNHCLDTIPMQITLNFDEVMKLASTNKDIDPEHERFFFAHDENLSYVAEQKFGEQSDDEEEEDVEEDEDGEEEGDVTLPKHLKITVNRGKDFDCVILEKKKDEFVDNFKSVSVST